MIATGGSAVFGEEAMEHLPRDFYGRVSEAVLSNLKKRLGDLKKRGVVLKPGQTLEDLLEYRTPY